jgi:hypothetical protein
LHSRTPLLMLLLRCDIILRLLLSSMKASVVASIVP